VKSDYEQEMENTPLYEFHREMKAFKGVPIDSRWKHRQIYEILDSAPVLFLMGAVMAICFWMGVLAYIGYFDEKPGPPPTPTNFRMIR